MSEQQPALDLTNIPTDKFYISGQWIAPHSDKMIEVVSPDTEEVIAQVAEASEADVDRAVAAAREAFDKGPWPSMAVKDRNEWVRKLSDAFVARTDEMAITWSYQMGMPYALAKAFTPVLTGSMNQYIDIAEKMDFVERWETEGDGEAFLVHEPVGVVVAIVPWNIPTNTLLNKVGPALVAGCTVVMKPAPQTPIEAYILAQCAEEIELPAGVLNLLCAERAVSDYLISSADVDKVSFTGSVAAGQRIASVCGERIARCSLELGGKSPAILLDDYDIDTFAKEMIDGICTIAGQNCALLSRALVSRGRHDELISKMTEIAQSMKVGHVFDADTVVGPVAMKRQLERIEELIAVGVSEGATLACGGKRPTHLDKGYFIEPTVFADVTSDMRIAQEEIFGPVICVMPYDDIEHAIEIANDSEFGLSGAVFTNDLEAAYKVARGVRTGTMGQNGPKHNFEIGFGGFKKSGIGREGGKAGLNAFLESKTVVLNGLPKSL